MPELPEVESVRRLMRRVLQGKRIVKATIAPDEIVLSKRSPKDLEDQIVGRKVVDVGRKGKFWWLELEEKPWLFGHLGMSGWIRHLGREGIRLHSHGDAPLDDEQGVPRFLKLLIETDDGDRIAFTDGRRLGRLWLAEGPQKDPQVLKLGRDVYDDLHTTQELHAVLSKRKAPIKALLLDQSVFAGVGNWIADEVLYHAGIAPARTSCSLKIKEIERLRGAIEKVVGHAVDVDADYTRFPDDWLFTSRWGGKRGVDKIAGHKIVRETVGGRTTAWVPDKQR